MISRLVVVLIGIPAVYGLLVWHDFSRFALFAVAALLGQQELNRLFAHPGSRPPILEYTLGVSMLWAAETQGERGLLLATAFGFILPGIAIVLRGLDYSGYKSYSLGVTGLLYLPFSLSFLMMVAHISDAGGRTIFAVLCLIWALDIGAYLVGCTLQGPRLAPHISPKKTVSGAVGGVLACAIVAWSLRQIGWLGLSDLRLIALILCIGIVGQISDLFESVLKREAGVKDSGALLASHGGILDRIDSLLFVSPLVYAIFSMSSLR
ncbi:MAG TPA: phosphatidate cytidylyltransferase [Candidatus Ozemobacteraceae bacterium]|nr:phosphatidate cytidylyltransferase [Candidatus Ozemobacteraceae bacterium]